MGLMSRSMMRGRLSNLRMSEDVIQSLLETLWRVEMTRLSRSANRDLMEHLGIFRRFVFSYLEGSRSCEKDSQVYFSWCLGCRG